MGWQRYALAGASPHIWPNTNHPHHIGLLSLAHSFCSLAVNTSSRSVSLSFRHNQCLASMISMGEQRGN
jgi:hypothetical protein